MKSNESQVHPADHQVRSNPRERQEIRAETLKEFLWEFPAGAPQSLSFLIYKPRHKSFDNHAKLVITRNKEKVLTTRKDGWYSEKRMPNRTGNPGALFCSHFDNNMPQDSCRKDGGEWRVLKRQHGNRHDFEFGICLGQWHARMQVCLRETVQNGEMFKDPLQQEGCPNAPKLLKLKCSCRRRKFFISIHSVRDPVSPNLPYLMTSNRCNFTKNIAWLLEPIVISEDKISYDKIRG